MKRALNYLSIVSVLAVCFKLLMADQISTEMAMAYLVLSGIILALNSLAWQFVKAALVLVNFVIMLSDHAHDANDLWSLVGLMLTVVVCIAIISFLIRRILGIGSSSEEEHFVYNRRTRKLKRKGW